VKLVVALAPPMLALLAVGAVEAVQASHTSSQVQREAALTEAAVGPSGLFNSLQDERNRAATDLADLGDAIGLPVATNQEARELTDRSLTDFRDLIGSKSEDVRQAYAPGFTALEGLEALRADIDAKEARLSDAGANVQAADEVFGRYSELIGVLLDSNAKVTVAIEDPELRRGADLSFQASVEADVIARLITHVLTTSISEGNLNETAEMQELGELYHRALIGQQEIARLATGEYTPFTAKVIDAGVPFYDELARTIERGSIDPGAMLQVVDTEPDESYDGPYRDKVGAILEPKTDDLVDESRHRMWLYWGLELSALAVTALSTWLVSRSITRPLRSLTRQAADMANRRLPEAVMDILEAPLGDNVMVPVMEPMRVNTRDEVSDVADALNTVQDSALDLAFEQAVLRRNISDSFVNLGRRNQNLLSRQLDFITELEHNETDPDVLANLFRLDHLATRMRRNAESLLVLAGVEPPRKWAVPVRVTDIIRAALGEVEDYQRVAVRSVEPAMVGGTTAADLAHLMAELIENALVFSPPDHTVEIRGRCQPMPGYSLAIIDTGLGMAPEELARANRRLAGAESFTIAPSKYLGHYVAGNLAARHGITVTLQNQPGWGQTPARGRGITVLIAVPPAIVTSESRPAPTPSDQAYVVATPDSRDSTRQVPAS
jgi:signal transduction histidine kinase